jgi:hypothetical protein
MVALLYGQLRDLSARGRRETGALARLDGSGARIGDALSHNAALDHSGLDRNRIRSRVKKQAGAERGDTAANNEKTAALHAGSLEVLDVSD